MSESTRTQAEAIQGIKAATIHILATIHTCAIIYTIVTIQFQSAASEYKIYEPLAEAAFLIIRKIGSPDPVR